MLVDESVLVKRVREKGYSWVRISFFEIWDINLKPLSIQKIISAKFRERSMLKKSNKKREGFRKAENRLPLCCLPGEVVK